MNALKFTLPLIALLVCFACNHQSKEKSTTQKQTIPLVQEDSSFVVMGNEPFWSIKISAKQIEYITPEASDKIIFPAVQGKQLDALTKVYHSEKNGAKITITLRKEDCPDTMSDKIHSYCAEVTLIKKSDAPIDNLVGCADYNGH